MRDINRISYEIYYRLLVALLTKFNLHNQKVHKLVRLPKIEDDLFQLRCFIEKGYICIDVGANVGMYTVMLSKLCRKNGAVLSFEPDPHVFHYLSKIVRNGTKGLSNVQLFQMAVGNHVDNVSLIYTYEKSGRISDPLRRIGEGYGDVKMTSLDAIVKDLALPRVDFIKIDVENYELNVLKGSLDILKQYHPIILIEVDNTWLARYNCSYEDILSFLGSLGYEQVVLDQCSFRIISKELGNVYFKWFE